VTAAALLLALLLPFGACADEPDDPPAAGPAPPASSAPTAAGEPSAELASVTDDALRVTPPLEAYFFSGEHAVTVDEAVAALADAGQELSPGNTVGGYLYDEADEDFKLCIEGPNGAFATYDTSPMSLFETGESGGCPA
jgi:hypothetical protein